MRVQRHSPCIGLPRPLPGPTALPRRAETLAGDLKRRGQVCVGAVIRAGVAGQGQLDEAELYLLGPSAQVPALWSDRQLYQQASVKA